MDEENNILGNGTVTYKKLLDKEMLPVTSYYKDKEFNKEIMWLKGMAGDKWVEDYMTIHRTTYDVITDEDKAICALIDGKKMLVKAPNVSYYRIPEDIISISKHALQDCPNLLVLDVPYTITEYEINEAVRFANPDLVAYLHDWAYDNSISDELKKEIEDGIDDEFGFVYSRDGKRLLKAASHVGEYWIPEGVEKIERLAFDHCTFDTLHIPCTCNLENLDDDEFPVFGSERVQGCFIIWDRPYAEQDTIEESLYAADDDQYEDEYHVVYTRNMKRLLFAKIEFDESEYVVPNGVETICSHAFSIHTDYLVLSVPRSIKVIGDSIFGEEGGKIVIRD